MYKTFCESDLAYLRSIIPPKRVYFGDEINPDYSHDELGGVERYPDVLVEVLTAQEVSMVMKYANDKRIPVVARGAGTGLVGGCVPIYGGIMLCFSKMSKILELDEENLTLTVEPGALLMEISPYVEERGLFYPPDPGEKSATIGGNISTNAGGMRAVKYGVTRDYVRGLEVVLPSGDIIELGGKVVKNSSGYSLKDLIVGSEGTLGIVTKAILKLLPIPQKFISLLIPFDDVLSAISAVPPLMITKVTPTAVEFMEREVILDAEEYLGKKFPDKSADAYLLLTYDGLSSEDIERNYDTVADVCFPRGGKDILVIDADERNDSVWPTRSAFLEAIKASTSELDECDVVVPISKLAEFVEYTYSLREKHSIRIKCFGHAGDGNVHIYALRDKLDGETWSRKRSDVFSDLYRKAAELKGKVSGEHGIGFAKIPYFKEAESAPVWDLIKNIKAAFDPNRILNPGKIISYDQSEV
jgi:glycolate oxidase